MHDLLRIIKRAAMDAYESEQMIDLVCGSVKSVAPLTVTVEGDHEVRLLRRAGEPALEAGDTVYLIRVRGGQRFLLLDKAVSA